ncbi:MAG: M20/M25/M40 family metallo-hydrolase, partial [Victivallaceae bacterium]|nr:M20/M25/M40 family metallo-hydrolase [Victivallaceae bacterium]
MSDLSELEPRAVWRVFDGICKIPHPSGKEEKLVAALCAEAERSGLLCRRDACGNLRIDRKGGDFDRAVLLQAHLDMVPSCVEGKNFDFETQSISPVVENGIVRADGTTLGGDDGMGVALALAALEAPELSDLPLAALFTREEETGMIGAQALDDEFLRGAAMVNLDSGCDEVFQTGCAGGVRSRIFFEPESVPAPEGEGVSIRIDGLAGGHSGIDIGKGRANAFVLLAKIVKNTAFYPAEFFGGKADNVIPSSAGCRGVAGVPVDALRSVIAARADRLRKTMTVDSAQMLSMPEILFPFSYESGERTEAMMTVAAHESLTPMGES